MEPEIPNEVWMLWVVDSGIWVPAIDDTPGVQDGYLCCTSEESAKQMAAYQLEMWYEAGTIITPVRVK